MTGILLVDIILIGGIVWFSLGVSLIIAKIFLGP
jgi:hypothetical protein